MSLYFYFSLIIYRNFKSYDDSDTGAPKHPPFQQGSTAGPQLPAGTRLGVMSFMTALQFFKLFFTILVCGNTYGGEELI